MSQHERFSELFTEFLEGELTSEGIVELNQLLLHDDALADNAVACYQLHRMLSFVANHAHDDSFVQETMRCIPIDSEKFVKQVLQRIDHRQSSLPGPSIPTSLNSSSWLPAVSYSLIGLAIFALLAGLAWMVSPNRSNDGSMASVRFINTARSRFLGEYSPAVGSAASFDRDYVLTSGAAQLQFPNGAETIIEGPAVFHVTSSTSLLLLKGRCSVHAPKGAEGFLVDTPKARIVDRGTRFAVNVGESSDTEVHVIEGAADLYQSPEIRALDASSAKASVAKKSIPANQLTAAHPSKVRLLRNEARLLDAASDFKPVETAFKPRLYQPYLPDRVVSYSATMAEKGGAQELTSVSVQRDGVMRKYSVEELTGVELIWFRVEGKIFDTHDKELRHLATAGIANSNRQNVLSDRLLNTGAINPGGSKEPSTVWPGHVTVESSQGPFGLAVRFNKPVINRPGPDIVFFELQNLTGAPDGDSFHVIPFGTDKRPLTIYSYDLTLTSPESLKLADFYLHDFLDPVDSLDQLHNGTDRKLFKPLGGAGYRALAVAIDLSQLGYGEGEAVEQLLFQDSLDDAERVDPVYIGGLP
jgi:hypothetical protein